MIETRHKKDIIYEQLKEGILTGKYPVNMKLPKELDFARELGIGKVTLRSALIRLEEEQLLARVPSKGTFVLNPNQHSTGQKQILAITTGLDEFESPNKYILPGIENCAAKLDYEVILCERSFIEALSIEEFKNSLTDKNIIGIIVMTENFIGSESIIEKLKATDLPIVLPHATAKDTQITGFASIQNARKQGWIDAIKHLHDQGHERVATIRLTKSNFRGFTDEEHLNLFKTYGMSTDQALIGRSQYNKTQITEIVNNWLDLQFPPTAILCFSDFFAIEIYDALKQRNIKIPDDIAVMGYCGYPGGNFMSPPLSTVDFEYSKLGKMSVELLLKADDWFYNDTKTAVPQLIKQHKLIIRKSTDIKRLEKQYMEELVNA